MAILQFLGFHHRRLLQHLYENATNGKYFIAIWMISTVFRYVRLLWSMRCSEPISPFGSCIQFYECGLKTAGIVAQIGSPVSISFTANVGDFFGLLNGKIKRVSCSQNNENTLYFRNNKIINTKMKVTGMNFRCVGVSEYGFKTDTEFSNAGRIVTLSAVAKAGD